MALNDVPLSSQTLTQTQNPIRQNFSVIGTAFAVNHIAYNDGSGNQGKHNFVQFPVNASPGAGTVGEIALYNSSTSGASELYLKRGTGTAYSITQYGGSAGSTQGWTSLPSGMKVVWGLGTINSGSNLSVTYIAAVSGFPGFSTFVGNVQLTPIRSSSSQPAIMIALQSWAAGTTANFVAQLVLTSGVSLAYPYYFVWMAIGI